MRGVRLTTKKREHLLHVYWSEGYHAAKPLAIQYGICPKYICTLAVSEGKSVRQANIERARVAVNALLAEFKVGREDLCRSRFPEHVRLRRIAIKRLRKMALSQTVIALAMQVHESSVRYWLNGNRRESKRQTGMVRSADWRAKAIERGSIEA